MSFATVLFGSRCDAVVLWRLHEAFDSSVSQALRLRLRLRCESCQAKAETLPSSFMPPQKQVQPKADEYKAFLRTRLQADLQRVSQRRALAVEEHQEYGDLFSNIQLLLQVRYTAKA